MYSICCKLIFDLMQLINFHPFMHRVRDSTASACSRANRILAAYFYLCSKLIFLNRINSLSHHFAPRIPKVRRVRICISDHASLPGIFRPPSFRHVMENAARVPLTMTASVFVRFFRERAATADARGRTSFYIPLATWKRTCTVAVPPECLLSVSLSPLSPHRRTPPVTASFLFATSLSFSVSHRTVADSHIKLL